METRATSQMHATLGKNHHSVWSCHHCTICVTLSARHVSVCRQCLHIVVQNYIWWLPSLKPRHNCARSAHKTSNRRGKLKFSPSCNCLPSRRPLGTDTHPIDVIRWLEVGLGDQLFGKQPGFDLPRRYWSKITHFGLTKVTVHPATKKCGLATSDKCQCGKRQTMFHIVSSWRVAYRSFNWLKMPLFSGWCHMVHNACTR